MKSERIVRALMILPIAVIIALLVAAVMNYQEELDTDGRYRDAALQVRSTEAMRLTQGAIYVQDPSASSNRYDWNTLDDKVRVKVKVGSCRGVDGYFRTPTRPQGTKDVSVLYIIVPSAGDGGDAVIPITDPVLYPKLLRSGLAHCIAGDSRLPGFTTS